MPNNQIPTRYFVQDEQLNNRVTEVTGRLAPDFIEVLRHGDSEIWLDSDTETRQLRPKTLVLTDWTLRKPANRLRLEELKHFLTHFFTHHPSATLYVWQDNHFVKLSELEDISQLDTLVHACKPICKATVIKTLAKDEQVAADHVMIIDQHAARYLYEDQLPQSSVLFSDLENREEYSRNYSSTDPVISNSLEPNTQIILDQYPCNISKWLKINPSFNCYPIIENYRKLTIKEEIIQYFYGSRVQGIQANPHLFDDEKLNQIETLVISSTPTHTYSLDGDPSSDLATFWKVLVEWLTKHNSIKNFHFSNRQISLEQMQEIISSIYPTVEVFEISDSKFSEESCAAFDIVMKELSNAPHLTSLYFYTTPQSIINPSELGEHSFNHLTSLTLYSQEVSVAVLASLKRVAPSLQNLSLIHCCLTGDDFGLLTPGSLTPLKHLSFSPYDQEKHPLDSAQLKTLFLAAPMLMYLSPTVCENFETSPMAPESISLTELKTISLNQNKITSDELYTLLTGTPNLTKLNIQIHNNIENALCNLEPNALPLLRTANLSSTNINSDDLRALFLAAPNLKFLDIDYCKNIKDAFLTLKPNSLAQLTSVKLKLTEIDTEHLHALLKASPNLISIELGSIKDTQESKLSLKPNSLPQLRTLDLSNTNITTQSLSTLAQAAPHLNALNISKCQQLCGTLSSLPPNSLEQLKEINLRETKLTNSDLNTLLTAAPNLTSLMLNTYMDAKEGLSSLKPNSLANLKVAEISETNIQHSDLHAFLNATPNITSLTVGYQQSIQGVLTNLMPNSLPYLEIANFISSNIDEEDLWGLFDAAPNLKTLTLNDVQNIREFTFVPQSGSLPHLEVIKFPLTKLNDQALRALREAAPNAVFKDLLPSQIESAAILLDPNGHSDSDSDNYRGSPQGLSHSGASQGPSHSNTSRRSGHNSTSQPRTPRSSNSQPSFEDTINPFTFNPNHNTVAYEKPVLGDSSNHAVIMQLSRYLTLTNREVFTPKIQRGICAALSNISLKYTNFSDWIEQLETLSGWDGETVSSLNTSRENLLELLFQKTVLQPTEDFSYLPEDQLKDCLQKIKPDSSFCLGNSWHTIAIRKITRTGWSEKYECYNIYDPNTPADSVVNYSNIDELVREIKKILGPHVGIIIDSLDHEIKITDVESFIKTGGLLWLTSPSCNNAEAIYEAIHEYCERNTKNFSKDIIISILMRNFDACPVWHLGANHRNPNIRSLFNKHLIPRFQELYLNAENRLTTSLTDYTELKEKDRHLPKLISDDPENQETKLRSKLDLSTTDMDMAPHSKTTLFKHSPSPDASTIAQRAIRDSKRKLIIDSLTETYQTALSQQCEYQELSVDEDYLHTILFADAQNILAKTSEPEALINQLYQRCSQAVITDHVFVIRNANELSCASAYLKAQEADVSTDSSRSVLTPGPGGPLYDFLQQATANPDTTYWIFIDYANFTAEECVRLNDIISDERLADGTAVPKHVRIIGVTSPSNYAGLDFDSRFQRKFIVSSNQTVPMPSFPEVADNTPSTHVIDLQDREDWQAIFNGELTFGYTDHEMYFEQAQGIKAAVMDQLKAGDILELKNAPLTNPEFSRYWNSLAAHYHDKGFKLRYSTGYDWATLFQGHTLSRADHANSGIITINPQLLQQCFSRFNVDTAQHQLHFGDGVLKEHEGKHLTLQLTHTLSPSHWAQLFTEANKLNVTLNIRCLNGVTLPDALASSLPVTMGEEATAAMSEEAAAMTEDKLEFNPSQPSNVIFSDNVDHTTTCLEGQFDSTKCLSIDVTEMTAADLIERVDVKMEQDPPKISFDLKIQVLLERLEKKQTVILKGPVPSVLAQHLYPLILKYPQQLFIVTRPDDLNWHALPTQHHQDAIVEVKPVSDSLTTLSKPDLKPYSNFSDSDQLAAAFDQERIHAVTAALAKSPIAILNGITGTGKTTFVKNILTKVNPRILYTDHGLADRQLWARNRNGGLLLIDEANLEHGDFSVFEGLFAKQPYIILDGTHHSLTPKHRVIFCQNPASYGSGREVKRLFIRHDNSVVFNPLPLSYIHARILSPILKDLPEALSLMAHESLLALYHFIYDCSQDRVLISARELKTMAQMMVRAARQLDSESSSEAFKHDMAHIIKLVAEPLVPSHAQTQFAQQFLTDLNQSTWEPRCIEEPLFVLTELWQQPYAALTELLALRDQHNDGGLGGLVLEGDPSLGKSQFFKAVLAENAIPYQHIPANLHTQEKEQRLLDAFYKGEIVVIDELSSQGNLERLLNELLMGHHPLGKTPRPGFMVLGTQNPIHMAGRRSASQALRRRLLTYELGDYQPHEVEQICEILLTRRGFKGKDLLCQIEALAKAYQALKNSGKAVSLRSVVRVVANAETPQDQKILAAAAPREAPHPRL